MKPHTHTNKETGVKTTHVPIKKMHLTNGQMETTYRIEVETNSDYYNELRQDEVSEAKINMLAWCLSLIIISVSLYFLFS